MTLILKLLEEQQMTPAGTDIGLSGPAGHLTLKDPGQDVGDVLHLLPKGASEQDMSDKVMATAGFMGLCQFQFFVKELITAGMLTWRLTFDNEDKAQVYPTALPFAKPLQVISKGTWQLSRFATCRPQEGKLIWWSPRKRAQLLLTGATGSAWLVPFVQAVDVTAWINDDPKRQAFVQLLNLAGLLTEVGGDGRVEETDSLMGGWEPHDLAFHNASRAGMTRRAWGGTFRFDGVMPSPPLRKTSNLIGDPIPLPKPDLTELQQQDRGFTTVLETRRSIRNYGQEPLDANQLGAFLYRSARVRQTHPDARQDLSSRPYPGGGAIYELELYLGVNQNKDIARGFYHYDPFDHCLEPIAEVSSVFDFLIGSTGASAMVKPVQTAFYIATRLPRLTWKYEGIAYSVTLKNTGVLIQTMYLVATAMGLAPTAVGSGNSDLFAAITGIDPLLETTVGEFLLGSFPENRS